MIEFFNKFFLSFIKKKLINYLDKNYLFVGWNLKTKTCSPWKNTLNENKILQIDYFNDLNEELKNNIKKSIFFLHGKKNKDEEKINDLKWRHYNILLSLKYLIKSKKSFLNLVEAGVADGLSAWFVLNALAKENINYNQFILIDSWEPMKSSLLKKNENKQIGRHKENDINRTKKNLSIFKKTKFLKGFVPDVLKQYDDKQMVDWLHIDLNSSIATKHILDFFSEKFNKNSIIIFDDYGWPNHEETRIEIDKWTMKKSGILWPLATGQAIFFNF
jgi:hypothetical protein